MVVVEENDDKNKGDNKKDDELIGADEVVYMGEYEIDYLFYKLKESDNERRNYFMN